MLTKPLRFTSQNLPFSMLSMQYLTSKIETAKVIKISKNFAKPGIYINSNKAIKYRKSKISKKAVMHGEIPRREKLKML